MGFTTNIICIIQHYTVLSRISRLAFSLDRDGYLLITYKELGTNAS